MKRYVITPFILLATFITTADEKTFSQSISREHYQECIAVSLYTIEGRELNSIVKNNREIVGANAIPEGWSVVGITTKKEAFATSPYLVICH
jgi:hypothetical protein